jgi:NADPH:quinone reductase
VERHNPFTQGDTQDSTIPDEELVAKAQAGDRDALEGLVRRHQAWVFNIAIRMVWRRDLAEDATQEILIKLVTKLSTFKAESQFRTWLYRIAVNHLLNLRKSVVALMGGMGRTINGSYAEYTNVPGTNVVSIQTDLSWEALAAIPESYATAWSCLYGNLGLQAGQTVVIRGASSALGQAALNIAAHAKVEIIATTRNPDRFVALEKLGAGQVLREGPELIQQVRTLYPDGVDAVLDLVGNTTVLGSLTMVRRGGHVCEAGWLGGLDPIASFNPMLQMPSGVHYSLFASFMFGLPQFPLEEVPMQIIVNRVAAGSYQAKPAKVFSFDEIQAAHQLMESGKAVGKIVVQV